MFVWTEGRARICRSICVAIICGLLGLMVGPTVGLPITLAFMIYIILTYNIENDKDATIMALAQGQLDMRAEMDNLQRRLGEVPVSDTLVEEK